MQKAELFCNEKEKVRGSLLSLVCAVLAIAVFGVYYPVLGHPFVRLDDMTYVTQNPHVTEGLSLANISWAFTSSHSANWHPVTWISHMLDVQLFGLNPHGHHLTNLLIHTASSVLLLVLLATITRSLWKSALVAALFALHPTHVESVAWVAERKDVLSAFFCFLTLLLYSQYVKSSRPVLYALALLSFLIGLMSKPMLVTLPVLMLLMDLWPLDRYRQEQGTGGFLALLKEKIPFFLCSLASSAITIYAQSKGGAVSELEVIPMAARVENALLSYVKYLWKTVWPTDLAVYYPLPSTFSLAQVSAAFLTLVLLSAFVIRARRSHPYVAVGWGWYLVTLLPVIGIIQVGDQSMADRYSYLPSIGLFIILTWGISDLFKGVRQKKVLLAIAAGAVILTSSFLTRQQVGYWSDDITLFRHALQVTSNNYFVHHALGLSLADRGDTDAAIDEVKESLRIYRNNADAHISLGILLAKKGMLDMAIAEFRTGVLINPKDAEGHKYLGSALFQTADTEGAIQEFRKAVELDPDSADAHVRLAAVFASKGDLATAVSEYQAALRINPSDQHLHNGLGITLAKQGNIDAAIQEFKNAIALDNNDAVSHNNLGFALASIGDFDGAIQEYQAALRINPDSPQVRQSLAEAMSKKR